ncbi:MAG: hypothetical protein ACI8RZ_004926, partial [Myxococcota bacterium]
MSEKSPGRTVFGPTGALLSETGVSPPTPPLRADSLSETTLGVGIAGETVYLNTGEGWLKMAGSYGEQEEDEVFFEVGTWEDDE